MRGVTHLATATTASTPTLTTASKQQQQQHSATGMSIAASSSSSSSRSSIGGISASGGGGGVLSSVRISRHQNLFTCRPRDGSLMRRRSRHRLLDEGGRGASTATRAKKGEEDGHGRDETTTANVESCLTVDTMMMGALRIEEEEEGKRAKASPAPLGTREINDESIPRRQQQR